MSAKAIDELEGRSPRLAEGAGCRVYRALKGNAVMEPGRQNGEATGIALADGVLADEHRHGDTAGATQVLSPG